jgi:DDE family transposase
MSTHATQLPTVFMAHPAASIRFDGRRKNVADPSLRPNELRLACLATVLTTKDVDDASQVGPLLDQAEGPIASFTGDGAYDQDSIYRAVIERDPDAAVIVPPRATAVLSETAETEPTQRDRHLQGIAEKGRIGWQKVSGYNIRSRVEAAMGRYKQVIGDGLRCRKDKRRLTEVAVVVHVLNRMQALGRPISVRIA